MKILGVTVFLASILAIAWACGGGSSTGSGATGDDGDSSGVSDLAQDTCVDGDGKASVFERVRFVVSDGVLSVTHENACRNCGFEAVVDAVIEGNSVSIHEADTGENPAMCSCLHHVRFAVKGVTPGTWTVAWNTVDAGGNDSVLFEETLEFANGEERVIEVGTVSCE